jgi:hypothetical protein
MREKGEKMREIGEKEAIESGNTIVCNIAK